jgi:hypothetical protein
MAVAFPTIETSFQRFYFVENIVGKVIRFSVAVSSFHSCVE